MIIYIHGFNSTGNTKKALELKKFFNEEEILHPSLPKEPTAAISLLTGLIKNANNPIMLVGSSLGAFYATYLSSIFDLHCILLNPTTEPWDSLPILDSTYPKAFLEQLKDIDKKQKNAELISKLTNVYLSKNDEILDYKKAAEKYKYTNLHILNFGNHSFESGFNKLLPEIKKVYDELLNIYKTDLKESEDFLL